MRDFLLSPLLEWEAYRTLKQAAQTHRLALAHGMADAHKPHLAAALSHDLSRPLLFVVSTDQQASRLHNDLTQLCGDGVYLFPPRELNFYHAAAASREVQHRRVETLQAVAAGQAVAVVASVDALMHRLMPLVSFQ